MSEIITRAECVTVNQIHGEGKLCLLALSNGERNALENSLCWPITF